MIRHLVAWERVCLPSLSHAPPLHQSCLKTMLLLISHPLPPVGKAPVDAESHSMLGSRHKSQHHSGECSISRQTAWHRLTAVLPNF